MAISRADAKKLISKSAVTVNGTIVKKSDIKIEVLNGTSRNGLANSVATKLKEEGYNVTKIGNNGNKDSIKTSIINRTEENYAKEIKSFLGKGTVKNEIEVDAKVDVTVILGSDY
jgi:16S rRNA U516 pseudouridylate synthase RsuA-like enzyme